MAGPEKILVTFPGKLGDLLYTLPAVIELRRCLGGRITYQTSSFCEAAVELLRYQPYLEDCLVDEGYVPEHYRYGCQPYIMAEPPGFETIMHLGFRRDMLGSSVLTQHLIKTFFIILQRVYRLPLTPRLDDPYIWLEKEDSGEFIVFQGYGETLMDHLDQPARLVLNDFWQEIFRRLNREVLIVSGEKERGFYRDFPYPVIVPSGLLETAILINRARCFVGVQSVAAAIANGLKVPRLVFNWFQNAYPTGAGGMSFTLTQKPAETAEALKRRFGL